MSDRDTGANVHRAPRPGMAGNPVGGSILELLESAPFMQDALCAQTDSALFYPSKGQHQIVRQAKSVCAQCPVVAECLQYALARGERHGIWGAKTERERRKLKPQRTKAIIECGSTAGYRAHKRRGEDCRVCREAMNRDQLDRKRRGAA